MKDQGATPSQMTIFEGKKSKTRDAGPVTCLGMTFENDEARREHFLGLLRQGLEELHAKLGGVPFTTVEDAVERMKSVEKWPMGDDARLRDLAERMRHAERGKDLLQRWKDEVGFPHGEIEDILKLSDPPYYTACPNPWIGDFIAFWEAEKRRSGDAAQITHSPHHPIADSYHREPFAADVSEGKNDPIYNAHSYHTKVPHKAIMRYILHYTEPGDVVFDGFCGTGMTGVAAQLCGDRKTVESLGFKVDSHGKVCQEEADDNARRTWRPFSKLGPRQVLLNDLSPAATFIAYNYNTPRDTSQFERRAKHVLQEVEHECGWMFVTLHKPSPSEIERACTIIQSDSPQNIVSAPSLRLGRINYVVWSDVFSCPECAGEIVFWDAAVDKTTWQVRDEFLCLHCSTTVKKRELERTFETRIDPELNRTIKQAKQVPALIHYFVGKERHLKKPDDFDFALLDRISSSDIPYPVPTDRMPDGDEARRNDPLGITHVHHFYTKRNLWCLAAFSSKQGTPRHNVNVSSVASVITKMYRFRSQGGSLGAGGGPLTGTLYVPSLTKEIPIIKVLGEHIRKWEKIYDVIKTNSRAWLSTGSNTFIPILADNVVDYIFTDPPFGANFMYSDLNYLWEAWLRVFTNQNPEAIESTSQRKGLLDYQKLMYKCFAEYYRVLKPGRWITIEFHNSKNSVWNAIQEALQHAGFVIADVRTLDKKQGTFKQVTSAGAVKQDLVISAYKPNGGLEEKFKLTAGTEEGVWDFVRTHLKQLPVFVPKDGKAEVIAERQNYLLFDRMVAFHVQRGVTVPLSAAEFYAGLAQRFPERDGMYFLPEQVAEYDKKRMKVKEVLQLQLFVTDEASAIQWLKQQLTRKPQTFQEIHPQFLKQIGGWQKQEKPLELSELLEQNFLRYDGKGPIPSQIVSWMKQSAELREIIQDEVSAGHATEENGQLSTRHATLIARAKDRWYVPDPNKAGDLEKLREKALLKEFQEYVSRPKKFKRNEPFRLEAVRAGFKKAWQERDYATIIAVARKIPENILQEDPKLLMWYDQAVTRTGETESG